NAASTLSIYPNPTTTNTAISFETTFDMVEVFNSLGAKVAEYRNVDRIEGMEAAGVYVIRVTNDSAVQNCRLIVK
ncbi:MAG: T9SS type A sorting domain-containing protein, partial [Bacteroidales bacterium]|nr:T9SS type A sorting domain-containing protein [Bacteroidales bacterium]